MAFSSEPRSMLLARLPGGAAYDQKARRALSMLTAIIIKVDTSGSCVIVVRNSSVLCFRVSQRSLQRQQTDHSLFTRVKLPAFVSLPND